MLDDKQHTLQKAHIDALEKHKDVDFIDVSNLAMTALTVHSLLNFVEKGLKNQPLSADKKTAIFTQLKETLSASPEHIKELASHHGIDINLARHTQNILAKTEISPEDFSRLNAVFDSQTTQYGSELLNKINEDFPGKMEGAVITAALVAGLAFAAIIKNTRNQAVDEQIAQAQEKLVQPLPTTQVAMAQMREQLEKLNTENKAR